LLQFVNETGEVLERGDVVVIAARQPGIQGHTGMPAIEVDLAQRIHDTAVCGVVHDLYAGHKPESGEVPEPDQKAAKRSGRSARKHGPVKTCAAQAFTFDELETLDRTKIAPGQIGHLVAGGLCVVCKVDADIAPIIAGDLLTTSATKGHAQKVMDSTKAVGAVLGKALGSLKKGKGTIPVLVTLR
jgi:hypothetical protein